MIENIIPVANSSTIEGYYPYDPEKRELKITFKSGTTYLYSNISQQEYDTFVAAESKGKSLNEIKKDKPYVKL